MIVDWLSFTVEVEPVWGSTDPEDIERAIYQLPDAIREENPVMARITQMVDMPPCAGRRPYNRGWRAEEGITVYYHPVLTHALIEFSGRGCQWLRERGLMAGVLAYAEDRMTRLDVAQDLTGVTPDEIIEAGYSGRFRAHSRMTSAHGTTHYIGSRTSERYARVYCWNDPHPRAGITRIEAVHRKEYAKIASRAIIDHGIEGAGTRAIAAYEFNHPAVRAEGAKLSTVKVEKESSKTLRWLITACAPAFQRLVDEGVIEDPEEFLRTWFLTDAQGYRDARVEAMRGPEK